MILAVSYDADVVVEIKPLIDNADVIVENDVIYEIG
jgi:hypothetical protein